MEGRDLRSTVDEIRRRVEENIEMPQGYHIAYGGQFESEQAASRTLMWASLGALLIIFMLLYGEFKSVSQSLVILVNMPLALIGGVFMLAICGDEVNIPAIIGFISLMGISTRNGMLLMSRYNHLKTEGMRPCRPHRPRIVGPTAAYCYDRTDLGSCADTAGSQRRRPRQRDTGTYGYSDTWRPAKFDAAKHICCSCPLQDSKPQRKQMKKD